MNEVYVCIGGTIFRTTRSTLTSVDGFFARLWSGSGWADAGADTGTNDHPLFVDRDPLTFPSILSFLRSGKAILSAEFEEYLQKLSIEADFYMLSQLSAEIAEELDRRSRPRDDFQFLAIPAAEANAHFQQGWTYVDHYCEDDVLMCSATGNQQAAQWLQRSGWREYECGACKQGLSYELYLKHVTPVRKNMLIVKRFAARTDGKEEANPVV